MTPIAAAGLPVTAGHAARHDPVHVDGRLSCFSRTVERVTRGVGGDVTIAVFLIVSVTVPDVSMPDVDAQADPVDMGLAVGLDELAP